ncbi:MAG: helix-hairpin-helix domain-containing protein, partial [Bacteroidota bacterium]|nr:helix-hairpin-helix domain-containing protein [Bacteroidota bacterium]
VWSTRTQADLSFTSFTTNSFGFMVSQFASYRIGLLRLQAAVGYFDTDDYNSRVYIYEPSVLYNFSFPSFYGNGIRCSMNARADLGKRLMVIAKLGITHYFDRSSISSGLQEISSKGMTDLELQVRWKF